MRIVEAEVPIRLSTDDMMNSDNFNLANKAKKAVDDENQRIADEKERQRIEALKAEHKNIFDIINSDDSYENKLEKLFDELVPEEGNADTIAGNLVNAINWIGHRWNNDGEICFIDGVSECVHEVNYIFYTLAENGGEEHHSKIVRLFNDCSDEIKDWCTENQYKVESNYLDSFKWFNGIYEEFLKQYASVVLDWIDKNPDIVFNEPKDMYSSEFDDETDLRDWEPKIDIEFSEGGAYYDLFRYVDYYGDTIGYTLYDLCDDFASDADYLGGSAEVEDRYGDCILYSVPVSEAHEFYSNMIDWCESKYGDLVSEYGDDPDEDEEEEEYEDDEDEEEDEDIDESVKKGTKKVSESFTAVNLNKYRDTILGALALAKEYSKVEGPIMDDIENLYNLLDTEEYARRINKNYSKWDDNDFDNFYEYERDKYERDVDNYYNESISDDIRKNRLKYDADVDSSYAEDGDTYAQIQDREVHEYAPLKVKKNEYGGSYISNDNRRVRPKVSTKSWGRVWKNGKLDKKFEGPKYKVRQDMARYLDEE